MSTQAKFSIIKDDVKSEINDILKKQLKDKTYIQSESKKYCKEIVEEVLKRLSEKFKGMKFFTHVTIVQKGDGGLHFGSSCCWNPETDGSAIVKFENDYFYVFVGIYGLSE
jgi:hypothetical protein